MAGAGLDVNITGTAAANVDSTDYLSGRILIFFGAVLMLSFVLLMVVFRSVLVPLKAVVMNILSIGAAFGVVVAVFQWGWGGDVFGISGAPIEAPFPMILFAIVFGVSMDYEVFLLSRVREEYTKTGDAARSVADGLASTARVITAAAAIMIVVFGSFVLEADRGAKLFGFSLALAVFLDATLVRMLLVPATMELLGRRNWWMPKWLDRILPRLSVEGSGQEAQTLVPEVADDAASVADRTRARECLTAARQLPISPPSSLVIASNAERGRLPRSPSGQVLYRLGSPVLARPVGISPGC